jgi:Tol biopolymer transport system component
MPLDEAVEVAKQVAEALAAAHERGIVHRDLKPANIKLTPNGTVKVLDFGLAKAFGNRPAETELSMMPTKASGSIVGAVVGTAAYMSPEQARGREVDSRTDIWAFGCVVYEMLTARQTFEGETVTDMIAKIVTAEPDLNLLPAGTPSSIRLLLESTLNKNAAQRLQHIGDMRLFLDRKFFPDTAAATTAAARLEPKASRGKLWIAALVALLIAALIPAALYFRSSPPSNAPEMHFELTPQGIAGLVQVSPDGQRLAYMAQSGDEKRAIWIRTVGGDTAQRLSGTEDITGGPAWSPDSRYLAFFADGKLKKVDVSSGSVQIVCSVTGQIRGFSWSREGVILFARASDNVIVKVPDVGGTPQPVMPLDSSRKESLHAVPVFLPDGKRFFYVVVGEMPEHAGIFVGSLDGKTRTRVLPLPMRINNLAYASPYLLLSSEILTAQRFDESRMTLEGNPVPVAEGIDGNFSVSDNGLLFYRKASPAAPTKQLTWFDRTGKQVGQVGAAANYGGVELSPNGDRAAVDIVANNNRDLWVIDIARAVPSRITFDPGADWSSSWSADGSRLLFASTRAGAGTKIYSKSSSGVGSDELVFRSDQVEIPVNWSHDGKYVVFSRPKTGNNQIYDTWVLDVSGEKKATVFVESPFDKLHARISPDGRWIAYATNDSGMYQIVVQSFPDPNGGKWQITAQGGVEPKWRRDGRELYYLGLDGKLMAVPIKADRTFEAGTPMPLFETPLPVNRNQPSRDRRFDVAPDGRFLIVVPSTASAPTAITAVVNWPARLTQAK